MTNSDHANGAEPRLRRPLPPRTMPRRNILGVFMQKDGSAQNAPSQAAPKHSDPPARSHPLGLPVEEDGPQQECIAPASIIFFFAAHYLSFRPFPAPQLASPASIIIFSSLLAHRLPARSALLNLPPPLP